MKKNSILIFSIIVFYLITGGCKVYSKNSLINYSIQDSSIVKLKVDSLLALSGDLQESNPDKAFTNAAKALSILQQNKINDISLSTAWYQMGKACFLIGLNDSSLVCFNKALNNAGADYKIKSKVFNLMCMTYRKSGKFQTALQYADSALKLYLQAKDSVNINYTLFNKAKVYWLSGELNTAMNLLFTILNNSETKNDNLIQEEVLGTIANIFMDLKNPENAKQFYLKAINKHDSDVDIYVFANTLNDYGTLLYEEKDYDSALACYNKALKVFKKTGQEDGVAVASQNIGITYVFLGQPEQGILYLKRALNTFTSLQLKNDMASALVDLGTAYMEVKQYDSATACFHKVLIITTNTKNAYYTKETLKNLFKLKKQTGDYKSAFDFYQQYVAFKDSIDNLNMQRNLQELEVKYNTAEHEKEIIHLRDKELIEKANNRFLIGMIFSIVLISLLLLFGLWIKRKKDIQLHKQNLMVAEKEKILMKEKIARQQAYRNQLENELEFKNRQLATHALNMMQKNTLLQELTSGIESKMNNADSKEKQNLNEIKHHLQKGLNADKDWELFKLYFEQVNERFFDKLREINPYLTENDYKLCALMKLNMNIKEMAAVLNISPNSLKNARYRLKKKINLNVEDKLNIFLNGL